MLRFIFAVLFLTIAAAPLAQAQPLPAANAVIAAERARADKAEHGLAIREAADQLEDAQTSQAYDRFEIWTGIMMGAFGVLITLLVIVFGFRTEKAAATAARLEVANAKGQIDDLMTEARQAAAAATAAQALAQSAQAQTEATKSAIDDLLKQSSDATISAKANAEEVARHVMKTRESAAIIDGIRSSSTTPGPESPKLTPAQEKIVEEAASGIKDTPEAEWSIEEYKTRIGKARYLDEDLEETIRLANVMAQSYFDDDEAYVFALNEKGDALLALGRYKDAIPAYEAVISRVHASSKEGLDEFLLWALHHKAFCLTNLGDSAGAEK